MNTQHKSTNAPLLLASFALVTALSTTAVAQTENVSEKIAQAKSNAALLQAQADEEKARAELEKIRREIAEHREAATAASKGMRSPSSYSSSATPSTPLASGAAAPSAVVAAAAIEEDSPPPYLVAIFGSGEHLMASVRYHTGFTQDVRKGEVIEGGYKVNKIDTNGVVLVREGRKFTLSAFPGAAHIAAEQERIRQERAAAAAAANAAASAAAVAAQSQALMPPYRR